VYLCTYLNGCVCVFVCFCVCVCLSILLLSSGSLAVHLLEGALQKAKDETEKARLRQVTLPPRLSLSPLRSFSVAWRVS